MKVEGAVWAATVLLIIYLAWRTVGPLITPIFFALILAYAAYPIHKRLSPRIGEVGSALALTVLIVGLGGLITFELLMVSVQVAASLYGSVVEFLGWLMNQPPLPPKILDFLGSFSNQLIPKLSEYISKRAFSIPTYLLQLLVFLFTFYYALAFSREITEEIRLLIPERNRRLGEQILESLNKTLGALVRAWLVLNVMKGFLMTLGFIIFGVSDLYTAIVAGFLTFVFSFVPPSSRLDDMAHRRGVLRQGGHVPARGWHLALRLPPCLTDARLHGEAHDGGERRQPRRDPRLHRDGRRNLGHGREGTDNRPDSP